MDFLSNWMKLSREERMAHIDLSSPCSLDQSSNTRRKLARQLILIKHELVNDVLEWQEGDHINVCHVCEGNSSNGYCYNPDHIYLGTHRENQSDKSLDARQAGGRSSPGRKFTFDEAAKGGRKGGKTSSSLWSVCLINGEMVKTVGMTCRVKTLLGYSRHDKVDFDYRDYSVRLPPEEVEMFNKLTPIQRQMALIE